MFTAPLELLCARFVNGCLEGSDVYSLKRFAHCYVSMSGVIL